MTDIHGIIAAMLTPMYPDEIVNTDELKRQVKRLTDAGVHGLFCLGTNGEAYALEKHEKLDVIRSVIDETAGRVPVFVGTGCVSTRETVALSRDAERLGADVLSVICPWFAVSSQEELYRHFMTVASAVQIPIVLYNIPARTGVNLTAGNRSVLPPCRPYRHGCR